MPEAILVIGAAGFIGRALADGFAADGAPVLRVLRAAGRSRDERIGLLEGSRLVVHAATASTPASSQDDPGGEIAHNLLDLAGWLEALAVRPRPLLYLSSAGSLYPGGAAAAREADPPGARSYHGAGKAAAEQFISVWARRHAQPAVLLRPSNVYGPGQRPGPGFGLIPHAIDCLLHDRPLTLWGDGATERDFLYVDDLVALARRIAAAPPGPGALAVNAAAGASTRLDDLLARLQAVAGRPLRLQHAPARGVDAPAMRVDPGLARARWDWQAGTSLDAGLAATWRWASRAG